MPTLTTRDELITYLERDISNSAQPRPVRLQASEGHFSDVLDAALERYSKDKPAIGREDIAGDGATFQWTLDAAISQWVHGFSVVSKIRIASTLATEREEQFLDPARGDYEIKTIPGATDADPVQSQLRLLKSTPAANEVLQIWYTRPHLLTATATTILLHDRLDFMNLAAALAFEKMAERAGSLLDNETGETQEYGDLVDRYTRMRDRRLKKYRETLLGDERPVKAAGAYTSLPTEGEHAPNDRWSHNLRQRGTR